MQIILQSISLSFSFFEQEAYLGDLKSLQGCVIAADVYGMLLAEVYEVYWLLPIQCVTSCFLLH